MNTPTIQLTHLTCVVVAEYIYRVLQLSLPSEHFRHPEKKPLAVALDLGQPEVYFLSP